MIGQRQKIRSASIAMASKGDKTSYNPMSYHEKHDFTWNMLACCVVIHGYPISFTRFMNLLFYGLMLPALSLIWFTITCNLKAGFVEYSLCSVGCAPKICIHHLSQGFQWVGYTKIYQGYIIRVWKLGKRRIAQVVQRSLSIWCSPK